MKTFKTVTLLTIATLAIGVYTESRPAQAQVKHAEIQTLKKTTKKKKDTATKDSDGVPYVTADQMPSFISYLEQDLTDKGVDISEYTFQSKDTALYVFVPDDYKYYNKKDLQGFSDGLQAKVHEAFNVWSATNGVSYQRYPMLYIKTNSNESIASETSFSHKMKVKVD